MVQRVPLVEIAKHVGHYYVLDAVAEFVRFANVKQEEIASQQRRRRARGGKDPDSRKRAPNWTRIEDRALEEFFKVQEDKKRYRMTNEWWDSLFRLLQPEHRSKVQVQRRLSKLNQCIRSRYEFRGKIRPEKLGEYREARLGQNDRAMKKRNRK